jgi:hypothetical protein
MKASKALKLEKTNVANKATVSFNSPGNYVAPYGKTVVRVSGRGASGNPTTGGNYAGESYVSTNPTTGGNYAGETYLYTNPTTGGNYAGETYLYTNPTTPGNTVPGSCIATLYQYFTAYPYTQYDEFPGPCSPLGEPFCTPFAPGGEHCRAYGVYSNPSSSNPPTPGNDVYTPYYNPTVPGNDVYTPYYNPTVPGNDNYTPYYNPVVPGNSGTPANIAGVTFPGGAADSVAPTVPPTATTLSYSASGFSVTVPSGGYVNLDNI